MNNKAALRIGWVILFLIITFLGDRLGGRLLQSTIKESGFRYSRLYSDKAQADILLLGNSRGLSFYQPHIEELTQKSTFNLSYNGMPIELGQVLLKDYLDRYEKPDVILIDVTMCDRSNEQLIAGFTSYMSYSQRLDSLIKSANPTNYRATRLSHLYRYNSEVFQRALFYKGKSSDENWIVDRTITPSMIDKISIGGYDYRIDAYHLESLKEIVELAQQNNIRIELLVSPYFPPFRERMEGMDGFIAAVTAATNLPVHDYSTALSNSAYFGDFQHINKEGSRVYMKLLQEAHIF